MNGQFINHEEFLMSTDDAYNNINNDITNKLLSNLTNNNMNANENMSYSVINSSVSNDGIDNNYNNINMNTMGAMNNNINGVYFGQMFSQNQYNNNTSRGIYHIEEEEEENMNNRTIQVQDFNQNEIELKNPQFSIIQQLQLAERANQIYRQQLKYMQDHLTTLRALLLDKENVIQNLMLRFEIGLLKMDPTHRDDNLNPDEIDQEELRKKAEILAQRTILENFELREMVSDLRDENFQIRSNLYELQDKANRYILTISKLQNQTNYETNNKDGNINEFEVVSIDENYINNPYGNFNNNVNANENYNMNNDGINYNHNTNNSTNSLNFNSQFNGNEKNSGTIKKSIQRTSTTSTTIKTKFPKSDKC